MTEILCDVDGVLGQFVPEVIRFCNLYGREPGAPEYTIEQATKWDVLEAFNTEHLQDRLDKHMVDTDFCRYMPVYPGAQDFVEELRGAGNLTIVTSPYTAVPNWCSARVAWLWENFQIDNRDVIFAKKKYRVLGDYLVDDQVKNCLDFNEHNEGIAVCVARPWNQDYQYSPRCDSYEDVLAVVT